MQTAIVQVAHHVLVVTKHFEHQTQPLTAQDFHATSSVLQVLSSPECLPMAASFCSKFTSCCAEHCPLTDRLTDSLLLFDQELPTGGVAYFNCGPESGASQPHKHIQVGYYAESRCAAAPFGGCSLWWLLLPPLNSIRLIAGRTSSIYSRATTEPAFLRYTVSRCWKQQWRGASRALLAILQPGCKNHIGVGIYFPLALRPRLQPQRACGLLSSAMLASKSLCPNGCKRSPY